jgi:hypothetical protein
MKVLNKNRPLFADQTEEPEEMDNENATEDPEFIDDPLAVVIEEEKDVEEYESTQDDMFDDDELDLDPILGEE